MRPRVRKLFMALMFVIVSVLVSGCIVCPVPWCEQVYPPHGAVFHVSVYDYYTGYPIDWAEVDLYRDGLYDWEFLGTWSVDNGGYAQVRADFLYRYARGGPETVCYSVDVFADGYYSEYYEVCLDYYRPSESLHYYLVPLPPYARDHADGGQSDVDRSGRPRLPEGAGPADRVMVGEPREEATESAD